VRVCIGRRLTFENTQRRELDKGYSDNPMHSCS